MVLIHNVLLVAAVSALASAAIRIVSLCGAGGLVRIVAAAPVAAALAVSQALVLGLAGLGTQPVVLTAAAAATWLVCRRLLPAPTIGPLAEVRTRWAHSSGVERALFGGFLGLVLAWAAWLLAYPAVGFDGIIYHGTEVGTWVITGHPGTNVSVAYGLPVSAYPLTNEVALSWACGIARSFVPVTLWMVGTYVLLVAAGWVGLAALEVRRPLRALAIAAVVTAPIPVSQLIGPLNDLPALTWLACAAALCASSARHPALLAPALVAGALAVGTKTTAVPLTLLVLVVAGYARRHELRGLRRPLLVAGIPALGLAALWYVRNTIEYGSPLWPFLRGPFGDRLPVAFRRLGHSLLEYPRSTIEGHVGEYADLLAGYLVLLAGAALAPLLARRRVVVIASAVAGVSVLVWANAPFTGQLGVASLNVIAVGTTRYLLPALAAAAVAVTLAGRWHPRVAASLLAAAIVWNIVGSAELGGDFSPGVTVVVAGLTGGAVLGALLGPRIALRATRTAAIVALAGASAALLSVAASGYLARHTESAQADTEVARWFASVRGYDRDHAAIAMDPVTFGTLAGDRLRHHVSLIARRESCASIARRLRRGWVVVLDQPTPDGGGPSAAGRCLAHVPPALTRPGLRVYGVAGASS